MLIGGKKIKKVDKKKSTGLLYHGGVGGSLRKFTELRTFFTELSPNIEIMSWERRRAAGAKFLQ